ncbi:MAG: serine/threonine-protein kinase [Myxococcota bacterium]
MSLPTVGTIVAGRYEVLELLGEGGMGAVYRAIQIQLRREIALKVILPQRARKETARSRFLREARIAGSLRHPNVVEIYDYGEYEDTLFLAMELLRGDSLREEVDVDLPLLGLERTLEISRCIADVLATAAQVPVVHRDLKPENVVVDRGVDGRERVVVVDFGLAFLAEDADEETGRLTREGVVTGTPDYMSPEQARGSSAMSPAADVYSLGAMMYEMLTRHVPFEGDAALVISRHLFVRPKSMREAHPEVSVPGALDDLVMRMLEKEPADRPTAAQVRDALLAFELAAPERMSGKTDSGSAVGRAARMISVSPTVEAREPAVPMSSHRIAWVGATTDHQRLALAAHGLDVREVATPSEVPEDAAAIFYPEATGEQIAAFAALGHPVVVDAPPGDVAQLTALLRAGAAEVVMRPLANEDVARKLLRAVRKARR